MANMRYRAPEVPKETPADALIERLRAACLARGANGIKTFATSFQIMDDSRDLKLDRSELSKALHDYKVKYTNEEFEDLFKQFDSDGSGNISFDEFLLKLRPPMNKLRTDLILKAFQKLDKDRDGVITVNDLYHVYTADKHPKFLSGEWSEKRCFEEWLKAFDSPTHPDASISYDEFMNYYAGISSSIDNDAYFDLMMKNSWKL